MGPLLQSQTSAYDLQGQGRRFPGMTQWAWPSLSGGVNFAGFFEIVKRGGLGYCGGGKFDATQL
jgi:hypothetical protein